MSIRRHTLIVENTSNDTKPFTLIGDENAANFGNDESVQIKPALKSLSYMEVVRNFKTKDVDLEISSFCISSTNTSQLREELKLKSSSGYVNFVISDFYSPFQYQSGMVLIEHEFYIDDKFNITGNIQPNTTMSFTFIESE